MKKALILIFSAVLVMSFIFSCSTNKLNPTSPNNTVTEMKSGCQGSPIQDCPGSNTNNGCTNHSGGSCRWETNKSCARLCHIPGRGEYAEELKWLDVNIVMEDPYFYTSDGYPGYYIGDPVNFEVQITNTGKKDYKNLEVVTVQEYHDSGICDRWWDPNPEFVTITAGEALPGTPTTTWTNITIKPGQEVKLDGIYTPPIATCSGLDQVSIAIKHISKCGQHATTLYYDPDATIYCPPPPSK